RQHSTAPLFPYTTLFRSRGDVSRDELERSVREIYRHISDWLLTKTESDIELRFTAIGARRATEAVSISQLLWAIAITKEHLWGRSEEHMSELQSQSNLVC